MKGNNAISGIYISTGSSYPVSGNKITDCDISNSFNPTFIAIECAGLGTTNATDITSNTVDNITLRGATSEFKGVHIASGKYNVNSNIFSDIAVAGNNTTIVNIASTQAGTFSVSNNELKNITTTGNSALKGIALNIGASSILNIDNNIIKNFKNTNSGGANAVLTVIESSNGQVNITNNTIGDVAVANDIEHYGSNSLTGIYLSTSEIGSTISSNTLVNLTLSNNTATLAGIELTNTGNYSVSGNTVRNLSSGSTNTTASGKLAVQGIYASGNGAYSIFSNQIYNLTCSGNAATHVAGFSESAPNAVFHTNKIWNIGNTSATVGSSAGGIVLNSLNAGLVYNNQIALGYNDACEYRGIWLSSNDANTKNIYFNSVYIGGTATGGNSYAFTRQNFTAPMSLKNNILANFRTGGAGKHYSIEIGNTTGINSANLNANCYYTATPSTTGNWGGTDVDFDTWMANTGEDAEYRSTDQEPLFTNTANCDLHINAANACGFNSVGFPIAAITLDIDATLRDANHPDIGADEFTPTAHVGEYVWRGWDTDDWDSDVNWQCELTPSDSPGERIVISNVSFDAVIQRGLPAATVITDELSIMSGAVLQINPGNSLTANGNTTLNGTLVIETPMAEGDATGSFIDNGTITGSGSMTAKRFINGFQWHEISSPIQNASGAIYTRTNTSGNFNPNFYWYDETIDLDGVIGTAPAGAFDSQNLVPGWIPAHNEDGGADFTLQENQGYMFYTDMNQVITYTGTPNTGNFDVSGMTFNNNDPRTDDNLDDVPELYDGWHLLGNPYPSSLDWDLIADNQITNIDAGVYVWDATGYSGYKNGVSVMLGNLNNEIPPMQGFFVRTTAAGGAVQIRNEHRTHGAPEYLKGAKSPTDYIKIQTLANGFTDNFVTQFAEGATFQYDEAFDLVRLFSYDATLPQLYSQTLGIKDPLSLNVLPYTSRLSFRDTLGLALGSSGTYAFQVAEIVGLQDVQIVLEDKLTGTFVNLRTQNRYEFNHDGQTVNDRFIIHYGENHAPVAVAQLEDKYFFEGDEISFALPVNTFTDTDFGDVLTVSAFSPDFSALYEWLSFANSEFTGTAGTQGVYPVTLRASDALTAQAVQSFNIIVSETTSIEHNSSEIAYEIEIYPNPATQILTVNNVSANCMIEFSDVSGRIITAEQTASDLEKMSFDVSDFTAGVYFVKISDKTKTQVSSFVKQ